VRNLFNLNIKGDLGTVLPTELTTKDSGFGRAWGNFLREVDATGVKITAANIDNAGKQTALPVDIHALK
jgi:hypothetical protein